MTPLARIGDTPSVPVLIHEIGHLFAGMHLGMSLSGIEPVARGKELARTHHSRKGVTPRNEIFYSLAGMYCQALHCPDSVDPVLKESILGCRLFEDARAPEEGSTCEAMIANGFEGDLERIVSVSSQCSESKQDRDKLLLSAQQEVRSLFTSPQAKANVGKLLDDLKVWLQSDDPDLFADCPPWVLYPMERANKIFASLR